jgi:hypothetical protein
MSRAEPLTQGKRPGPERLEITAILPDGGVVKRGLALVVVGIIWGNCAAAQSPALPWPARSPSGPFDAPAAPVDKPETPPSACQLRLTPDRAVFRAMGDMHGPHGCGSPDVVSLERVIGKNRQAIEISPPAVLRCETAEAIVNWVREDLTAHATVLGSNLAVIENFDSYECRGRNRIPGAQISEHGHANALDIRSFKLKSGASVHPTDGAVAKEFRLAMKTSACTRFTTVLGPGSDGFHEDHIHVDLAEHRNGYRTCHWELDKPADVAGDTPAYALSSVAPSRAALVDVPLPRPRPFEARADDFKRPAHSAERHH